MGLEPTAFGTTTRRSNQLSYSHRVCFQNRGDYTSNISFLQWSAKVIMIGMSKSTIKTHVNDGSVEDFINSVPDETKKADAFTLLEIYSAITKEKPKMWGSSIIGFGQYHYKSERSKQEGDWPLTGFSPRKQNLTLYVMPGFDKYGKLLDKLGKHKTSAGCLYINKLSDVDLGVLKEIVKQGYMDMKKSTKNI